MKRNGKQIIAMLEENLAKHGRQKLLLHVCCGPCSSAVLELLTKYFDITLYYYNPNIYPSEEYTKREQELHKVVSGLHMDVQVISEEYDPTVFYSLVRGHEADPEGGERCKLCYHLRMEQAVKYAKEHAYDLFTTTLSISPYKHSDTLNEIGFDLEKEYGVPYLYSDFKKNNGYLRSCQITRELGIYRQDYCGCVFSFRSRGKE